MSIHLHDGDRTLSLGGVLRAVYLGRLTIALGIFLGAAVAWGSARPDQTLVVTTVLFGAVFWTGLSGWRTHVLGFEPGVSFLLAQSAFDAALVTAIMHVTGGVESAFGPLYILVISASALLLPVWGVVLTWGIVSGLFLGQAFWWGPHPALQDLLLTWALFGVVTMVTAWLGSRLRATGMSLGAVESELHQLRVDTGDILANLSTGLMAIDGAGRLTYMNLAAETLLELDAPALARQPIIPVLERVSPGVARAVRRSLSEGQPVSRVKALASVSGQDILLGLSTAVYETEEGGPRSVTAIFQDITDADRLDTLNRRNERLEAVAELSASLAHEIKNPLSSIRSSVEQLARPGLEAEDRGLLEKLTISESDRLSRLLSEFIDYARIRSGHRELVDLTTLVKGAVDLARAHPDMTGEKKIRTVGLDDAAWVSGDADLLHRAVFNLILNAIHYTPASGEVLIALQRHEEVSWKEPSGAGAFKLSVSDDGPGVPPDERERIFDPFYTTRTGGSGLGLSIVYRAATAHAGQVFVERSHGGGARFVFEIPGARKASEAISV